MKLTGWQRLGVIGSALICLYGSISIYRLMPMVSDQIEIDASDKCNSEVRNNSQKFEPCMKRELENIDQRLGDIRHAMIIKKIISPILAIWIFGSIAVFLGKWIKKGFSGASQP
ncbi:hypothetical protein [Paramagnetospirillum magneticum]|uniref:hypothetical protein n=1 Tax=Paramagnetospirillum magneticum TaxID=84159 RepID=UPI0011D11C99|nr:hypothetical protein [Paramagnetospirillum magneticum]